MFKAELVTNGHNFGGAIVGFAQIARTWNRIEIIIEYDDAAIEQLFVIQVLAFIKNFSIVAGRKQQRGVQYFAALENLIPKAVTVLQSAGHPESEVVGKTARVIAFEALMVKRTAFECEATFRHKLRFFGDDVDRAARFTTAVQCRPRAFLNFNAVDG